MLWKFLHKHNVIAFSLISVEQEAISRRDSIEFVVWTFISIVDDHFSRINKINELIKKNELSRFHFPF
ncbi:protein of unknown function [Vibrio tapetis subsp. tapetis]|uniref:Uncharacterized protein n=1 Tax=Vibrio tapetis subsp. tapetis TaxID=1671868 RepID=A0A2N8ZJ85_9VIBR|nr:protein of unknown function [Vibrio tapetis subsp. tapetis]